MVSVRNVLDGRLDLLQVPGKVIILPIAPILIVLLRDPPSERKSRCHKQTKKFATLERKRKTLEKKMTFSHLEYLYYILPLQFALSSSIYVIFWIPAC